MFSEALHANWNRLVKVIFSHLFGSAGGEGRGGRTCRLGMEKCIAEKQHTQDISMETCFRQKLDTNPQTFEGTRNFSSVTSGGPQVPYHLE